jgi:hypothetical protein
MTTEKSKKTPIESVDDDDEDTDKESDGEALQQVKLSQNQELLRIVRIDKKDRTTWLRICSCLKHNGMSNNDWEQFVKIMN